MNNTEMIQQLPLININDSLFMNMGNDLSNANIKSLLGKNIIFKLTDDIEDFGLLGILEDYKDNQLIIRREGISLVFELHELFGIEEYHFNNTIEIPKELINRICEITNYKNSNIIGLVTDINDYDVVFKIKTNKEEIITINYPKELIKYIKVSW